MFAVYMCGIWLCLVCMHLVHMHTVCERAWCVSDVPVCDTIWCIYVWWRWIQYVLCYICDVQEKLMGGPSAPAFFLGPWKPPTFNAAEFSLLAQVIKRDPLALQGRGDISNRSR